MVENRILKELREADTYTDQFTRAEFDLSAGVAGSSELVAETQVRRPHALVQGVPIDVAIRHRLALHVFDAGEGGLPDDAQVGAGPVVVLPRLTVAGADVLPVFAGNGDQMGVAVRERHTVAVATRALDQRCVRIGP